MPPTETLPPLSFPPALSGSNADLRGFVSDMSSGFGAGQPQQFATVSKRALSGSRKSLMASYAEALSRSTEALAMAGADGGYVSQPVSRRGSELVSFSFLTLVYVPLRLFLPRVFGALKMNSFSSIMFMLHVLTIFSE